MRWYQDLYISEDLIEQKKKTIAKIKHGKGTPDIYVITTSLNSQNMLDIYNSFELRQTYYKKKDFLVLGLASGKEEAFQLVEKMIMDALKKTGGADVRACLNTENCKDG